MHQFFISLFYWIRRNTILSILLSCVVLIVCIFSATKINFQEDISQLIPKSDKSDITAKVLKQLNFSDKIIVIIEKNKNNENASLSETADAFVERLDAEKKYVKSIQGKVNEDEIYETFDFVHQNLPIFLDKTDYSTIEQKLTPDSIESIITSNYNALISPTSLVTKEFIKKDPLGLTFLGLQKLQAFNVGKDFILEDGYVISKDRQHLLLFIEPVFKGSDTKNNTYLVEKLYEIQENLNKEFKNKSNIEYFGSPLIAVANAKQIKKDIQTTVAISFTVLLLVLIFYFRNIFTPIIVFIPTLFAVAIALFLLFLMKDKVSAISLGIGAILIGITIDYALHILTHYKHKSSIEDFYKEITQPLLLSSLTTAASFLCLVFVKSEALNDLGLFAACSVIFAAFFSLIIIPQVYRPSSTDKKSKKNIIDTISAYPFEKNKYLIIGSTLIIVVSLFFFNKVKFNSDIASLNYVPKHLQKNEQKLKEISDIVDKSIYTISYAENRDDAIAKNNEVTEQLEKLQAQNKIASYTSLGNIVTSHHHQNKKINEWYDFWASKKETALLLLQQKGTALGFNASAFHDTEQLLSKTYVPLTQEEFSSLSVLPLNEYFSGDENFYTATSVVKVQDAQRSDFIKTIEKDQNVLAIDRQQLNENFLGLLKDDFNSLINYSLLVIIITIILFFRNIELSLLTMFPIVLTGIVTAGLLYLFNLELNIFSTIVCTLVFGVGDDFSIFLTQSMQKEHTTGKNSLPTYRTSIFLAVLTTILSIGSLIFAKHPALHSLALVALIGMFSVVIITSTLYPLWFRALIINRQNKGLSPITLRLTIHSALSFLYYGLGGIFFSILGPFVVKIANGKNLEFFKKIIAKYLVSVLYSNPFVKKTLIKNPEEDFSKPAIIIANHTSFLDTLTLAMVTHKCIFLVNDWVYNSPVFGKIVRSLGFYPVSQGIENGELQLQHKIAQGYSLMVFPEGSRSYDNNVKRFHKGAFYLADKFGLDIIPVYIHGNSEVQPKGDFVIYDGSMTVKVGERILNTNAALGTTYKERTKNINEIFRKNFKAFRKSIEDESYFENKLYLSFLYKETAIVSAVKKDFNQNKSNYFILNQQLLTAGKIAHIASDYGQIDFLLLIGEAGRKLYTYISDEVKREVAKTNYINHRRKLTYLGHPIEDFSTFDVLLISDSNYVVPAEKTLPSTIILLNTKIKNISLESYSETYNRGAVRIFKRNIL